MAIHRSTERFDSEVTIQGTRIRGAIVEVFTADDTWNKPDGAIWVEVTCVGGGGGGGGLSGAASDEGCGGGGSGYLSVYSVPADDLAATATVTVGSGGAGGTSSGLAGQGNDTTFVSGTITVLGAGGQPGTAIPFSDAEGGDGYSGGGMGDNQARNGGSFGKRGEGTTSFRGLGIRRSDLPGISFTFGGGTGGQGGNGGPSGGGGGGGGALLRSGYAGGPGGSGGGLGGVGVGAGGGGARYDSGAAGGAGADGICIVKTYW
jgi:hypothetical protein